MQQLYLNIFFYKDPTTGEFVPIAAIAGESAYEIAVRLGTFTGTEEEWNNYIAIERDKAIADIVAKATEAKESIPDDYTALAEEVVGKIDKTSITQEFGNSAEKVASQKLIGNIVIGGEDSINVFDKSRITEGVYIKGSSNVIEGQHPNFNTSNYISCATGDVIRYTPLGEYTDTNTIGVYNGAFYDGDKNAIRGITHNTIASETITVDGVEIIQRSDTAPEGAAYFRLNVMNDYIDSLMVTINNEMPGTYQEYGFKGAKTLNDEIKVNSAIMPFPVGFNMIAYSQLWAFAPINTVPNYETAGFLGFDMIKGDIRITSDNVLVMCHDKGFTFDEDGRITTYSASNSTDIRTMTAEQVLLLEHKAYIDQFGTPVHPCTVDDYLSVCSKWKKIPFVTIRDEYMDEIAPILVEKLKYWHFEDTAIINSFTEKSLMSVRKLLPRVWLHLVNDFQAELPSAKAQFCIDNYPCALGVFNYSTATDPDDLTDAMKNEEIVNICKQNRIPVFGAVAYTKKQLNYMQSIGYSGTQAQYVAPEFIGRKYLISIKRENGVWSFKRSQMWEYDGDIVENGTKIYVKCNDIVPTWLHYLSPTMEAKCTTDSGVTIGAQSVSYGTYAGYVLLTPSEIIDDMEISVKIVF